MICISNVKLPKENIVPESIISFKAFRINITKYQMNLYPLGGWSG
jgi:hypothetical protein